MVSSVVISTLHETCDRALSGGLEGVVALLPVAGAQFIGLQRIEHAQDFLRAPADAQVRDVHEADHAFGVDDVSGALRHARLRVENAERRRQLALQVREHRERQVLELLLVAPPGEMHELAVDADTEQLCIAGAELTLELAERGDLGGAYEGEVLGPEEQHLPLAGRAVIGEGLERRARIARNDAAEGELGKTLTDA